MSQATDGQVRRKLIRAVIVLLFVAGLSVPIAVYTDQGIQRLVGLVFILIGFIGAGIGVALLYRQPPHKR